MKNIKYLIFALLFAASCTADKFDHVAEFEGIVADLASPEFAGRSLYADGENRAASYIMDKFNEYCTSDFVEKPFLQPFKYPLNTTRGDMYFAVDGVEYKPFQDYVIKEFSTGADRIMPIVYALEEDIYTPDKFSAHLGSLGAENSFVVLDYEKFHTLPSEGDRYFKYLKDLNLGGVIFKWASKPNYFKARAFFTTPYPVICVGPEFPVQAGEATVKFQNEFIEDYTANNVVAWIRGTSGSDSCYVFVAHYDHLGMMGSENVCLGANDNASGTAALLTLAQYYSQPQNRPELDIMFLWVGGEEANLLGSKYYVQNPLYPLENIKYLINLDMIGDTPDMLYYEGGEEANRGLNLFMEINKAHGWFPNPHRGELVDNSDHYYFAMAGVPAMYFESKGEYYKYYHSPSDNLEHFTSESYKMIFEMVKEFIQKY